MRRGVRGNILRRYSVSCGIFDFFKVIFRGLKRLVDIYLSGFRGYVKELKLYLVRGAWGLFRCFFGFFSVSFN